MEKAHPLHASDASAASAARSALPDKPLITIEPSRSRSALDLRELWNYRELLGFLTWRDIKVRYKQTALGAIWAILQPLLASLVFTLFLGRYAGFDQKTGDLPYFVFAYAGFLPWTFFQNAVTNSGNSLVGNANLITKVYFPRMIIPGAAVVAGLVDLGIGSVILAGMMLLYGVALSWSLLLLPILVLLLALFALAVGMWMSALNVQYRDIRYALPFLIQLWMFATPAIYNPPQNVPETWQGLLRLNPLTGIIGGLRSSLLGSRYAWDWPALGVAAAITVVALGYSAYAFRRLEKSFADVV